MLSQIDLKQVTLSLNDIKQNLSKNHYRDFLFFIQHHKQNVIDFEEIRVLEDKIIIFKNNNYTEIKDTLLCDLLNAFVNYKVQNTKENWFDDNEISFLENLGIFPTKMWHHYDILDKLNQLLKLGIKVDFPSEFLSKKLKFPTIDISQLNFKPQNHMFLVVYTNEFNEMQYTSKLNPFRIKELSNFQNNTNLDKYIEYIKSTIQNTKNIDDESKNESFAIVENLKSSYLVPNYKKERLIFHTKNVYTKPTDIFNNYLHQRYTENQYKRVYNKLTYDEERQLYELGAFVSLLDQKLLHYNDLKPNDPLEKYKEIVIETVKEFKNKPFWSLLPDQKLQQFLKYQLDLDLTKIVKQKDKKENKTILEEYA